MTEVRGAAFPAAGKNKDSQEQSQQVVQFDDNRMMQDLLGEYDANLAMIEDKLGVHVVAHGNVITITGGEDPCLAAREILEHLYSRIEKGDFLGAGDVDGAIRHAGYGPIRRGGVSRNKDEQGEKTGEGGFQEQIKTRKRTITARTPVQSQYIRSLKSKDLVFATGPAGTGKTYLAVVYAASLMEKGEAERIILSRPAVEAGERLGFLPGDMKEKVDPYLRPLYDALYDVLPPEKVDRGLETKTIEVAPLAFMRGRTLSNAFIILDEAQNTTSMQMKMFLTRLGENSKMVVTGDPSQIDLPVGQKSGLVEATALLKSIDGIGQIRFTGEDVVRSELVAKIVAAYDQG